MIHIYICHMRCQVFGSDAFFCAMLNEQLNKSAVTKMHLGGALQSKIDPIAYVRHSLLEISQLKLEMVSENAVAFAMVSSSFSMLNIMKPELATKLGRQIYYYDRRNETRLKRRKGCLMILLNQQVRHSRLGESSIFRTLNSELLCRIIKQHNTCADDYLCAQCGSHQFAPTSGECKHCTIFGPRTASYDTDLQPVTQLVTQAQDSHLPLPLPPYQMASAMTYLVPNPRADDQANKPGDSQARARNSRNTDTTAGVEGEKQKSKKYNKLGQATQRAHGSTGKPPLSITANSSRHSTTTTTTTVTTSTDPPPTASKRHSLAKKKQRMERNAYIAALDVLLPDKARSKVFKGAGSRSPGTQGRSIFNVLTDSIAHIKTMHFEAASALMDRIHHMREDQNHVLSCYK